MWKPAHWNLSASIPASKPPPGPYQIPVEFCISQLCRRTSLITRVVFWFLPPIKKTTKPSMLDLPPILFGDEHSNRNTWNYQAPSIPLPYSKGNLQFCVRCFLFLWLKQTRSLLNSAYNLSSLSWKVSFEPFFCGEESTTTPPKRVVFFLPPNMAMRLGCLKFSTTKLWSLHNLGYRGHVLFLSPDMSVDRIGVEKKTVENLEIIWILCNLHGIICVSLEICTWISYWNTVDGWNPNRNQQLVHGYLPPVAETHI